MGAADCHPAKLDQVQHLAEKFGNFKSDPLEKTREAVAMTTSLKLLGDTCRCRGKLKELVPELQKMQSSRSRNGGTQIMTQMTHVNEISE